jgi:hypothetical protein
VLVAITNALSARVAASPLLWIPPLVLYLLTFIVAFGERWDLDRPAILVGAGLVCAGGLSLLRRFDNTRHEGIFVILALAVLTSACLLCHGFLHARRPAPRHLTRYYLLVALGGALGGTLIGLLAPVLFTRVFETDLALAVVALVGLLWLGAGAWPRQNLLGLAPLAILCAAMLDLHHALAAPGYWRRDFFGTVSVQDDGHLRGMFHGNILHGLEVHGRPEQILTYYGPESGLGKAIACQRQRKPRLRIGVVGLGAGNMAAHGRQGDQMRFYEISPLVLRLAGPGGSNFDLLDRCPAQVRVVEGDARLSLEDELRQGSQGFDVLLVDAFNGGQVPWHLLTREALELYLRHLDRDGILVLHLSSVIPLDRLIAATARAMDLWALGIYRPSPADPGPLAPLEANSTYALLARNPEALADNGLFRAASWANVPRGFQVGPQGTRKAQAGVAYGAGIRPWDDGRNSLIPLLWSALEQYRTRAQTGAATPAPS